MNNGLTILERTRAAGMDHQRMTLEEYERERLKIRTGPEVVTAVVQRTTSKCCHSLGLRQVSLEIYEIRKAHCEANLCQAHGMIGGQEACHACNCVGDDLDAKRWDKQRFCPLGIWKIAE